MQTGHPMTSGVGPSEIASPAFQPEPDTIRWRIHFRSSPDAVYRALATAQGRSSFWAESAEEVDGMIHFVLPGGLESRGRVIEAYPDRSFAAEYLGWTVRFDLRANASGTGTDLEMTCRGVAAEDRVETIAGWVSVLMAMKAAVDHGIDLRNHDATRNWSRGYADN